MYKERFDIYINLYEACMKVYGSAFYTDKYKNAPRI